MQQQTAVGDRLIRAAAAVDRADVGGGVETQSVDPVILQPGERVIADELADLGATVIRARTPAVRLRTAIAEPPCAVEVDPALPAGARAVEHPQNRVGRAEVVIDDIEDHRDARLVRRAHQVLQAVRAAVGERNAERHPGVIAP